MIESFYGKKANAGSEDGNGGDEVQGTVIVGQSYAIRSTRCRQRSVRESFCPKVNNFNLADHAAIELSSCPLSSIIGRPMPSISSSALPAMP